MAKIFRGILPLLGLSVFSSNLGNGIIAPLLPLYAESMGASGVWLGLIFASVSITSACVMPFTGRLSDRIGRKLILSIGLLILTGTSFSYVWAYSVGRLMLVRLVQGTGAAMVAPIAQAIIGDIAPKGQEGKWMGVFTGMSIAGFGIGPLMGGVMADIFGMNSAFYAMGCLNLISFLGILLILPNVEPGKEITTKFSIRAITASGITRGIFSLQTGIAAQRGILTSFLPVFAGAVLGLSPSWIGGALSFAVIINAILQVPGGYLADRFNRRNLVIIGSLGGIISMVLMPQAWSFVVLLSVMLFGGFGDALTNPPTMAMIVDVGRKYGMGTTTSIANMGMGFGMSLAPILAGFAVDLGNIKMAFYIAACITFSAMLCFVGFTRGTTESAIESKSETS